MSKERQISVRQEICTKEVLSLDEVSVYMGVSKSYLYKLTMNREIPHYKPTGRLIYFNRKELESWLLSKRVKTNEDINRESRKHIN